MKPLKIGGVDKERDPANFEECNGYQNHHQNDQTSFEQNIKYR